MLREIRQAGLPPRQRAVLAHHGTHHVEVLHALVAVEAVRFRQIEPAKIELLGKGVEKLRARAPQEADTQFPSRLRVGIYLLRRKLQVIEKELREGERRALADADHADVLAPHDPDGHLRKEAPQGERRDQTRAAGSEDEDVFDHVEKRPGGSYQRGRPGATPSGLKSAAEDLAIGGIVELREKKISDEEKLYPSRGKSIATRVVLFLFP